MQKSLPAPSVYLMPLVHSNPEEFKRLRRHINELGSKSVFTVAFEYPNDDHTRLFFSNAIGKPEQVLKGEIISLLLGVGSIINPAFFQNLSNNFIELSNAKRAGIVKGVYPVDISPRNLDLSAMNPTERANMDNLINMSDAQDVFHLSVRSSEPFGKVLNKFKRYLIAQYNYLNLRNIEMRDRIEHILASNSDLPVMALIGADHMPELKRLLRENGTATSILDSRRSVIQGLEKLGFISFMKAKRLEHTEEVTPSIVRSALVDSIAILSTGGCSSFPTISNELATAIMRVRSIDDARSLYNGLQLSRYSI